jgi:hypothetical protein
MAREDLVRLKESGQEILDAEWSWMPTEFWQQLLLTAMHELGHKRIAQDYIEGDHAITFAWENQPEFQFSATTHLPEFPLPHQTYEVAVAGLMSEATFTSRRLLSEDREAYAGLAHALIKFKESREQWIPVQVPTSGDDAPASCSQDDFGRIEKLEEPQLLDAFIAVACRLNEEHTRETICAEIESVARSGAEQLNAQDLIGDARPTDATRGSSSVPHGIRTESIENRTDSH